MEWWRANNIWVHFYLINFIELELNEYFVILIIKKKICEKNMPSLLSFMKMSFTKHFYREICNEYKISLIFPVMQAN